MQKIRETHRLPDPPNEPELTLMIVTPQGLKPITLPYGQHLILGRSDAKNTPYVDLAPYGGLELGVSREHAVIDYSLDAAAITDLGSTNGTYLNSKKLQPFQTRILRYGDELRLSKLIIYIYTQ
jgi:pSer/pThr/pTyr-binding forkhead associated (FHA) protein